MMDISVINSINSVAENIKHLDTSVQLYTAVHWWNTPWFSALIGALFAFMGTYIYSTIKKSRERLADYYQWFLTQGTFSDPGGLLKQPRRTTYGTPDKPLGEKMLIELRSHTKYWYEPLGVFRFLMRSYEKSISEIKDGNPEDILRQPEYKEGMP